MFPVTSKRIYVGTAAERTASDGTFLAGDKFLETDTDQYYLWTGMAWESLDITSPGGADTQLQYNNGGAFGGAADLLYDDVTGLFTVADSILVGATTAVTANNIELWPTAAQDARVVLINNQAVSAANTVGLDGYLNNNTPTLVKYGEFSIGSTTNTPGSEYGVAKIDVIRNGAMVSVLYLDATSGLSFNNDQQDINQIFRSVNAPQLLVLDAGANEVRIGSTTPLEGGVAVFGSSGVAINDEEADRDFRIAGSGQPNGFFLEGSTGRVGINTGTPGAVLHVHNNASSTLLQRDVSGNALVNSFYNANTTDGNGAFVVFEGDTTGAGAATRQQFGLILAKFNTHNHATRDATLDIRVAQSGSLATRMKIGAGIQVGSPTGGDLGTGWINVSAGVSLNNSNYANPDYALHHHFHGNLGPFADNPGADKYSGLVPLEKLESYLRKNLHLPNRWKSQNIFEWADMAQMWCEELAIYITQLHKRVRELENA